MRWYRSNFDAYVYTDGYANRESNGNGRPNGNELAGANSDPDRDSNGNRQPECDANENTYPDSNSDAYVDADKNSHPRRESAHKHTSYKRNSDSNAHAVCNSV